MKEKLKTVWKYFRVLLLGTILAWTGTNVYELSDHIHDLTVKNGVMQSAVMISYKTSRGSIQGSGVVVSSDSNGSFILTNKHVCMDAKIDYDHELYDGVTEYTLVGIKPVSPRYKSQPLFYSAQIVRMAENYDLCLVYSDLSDLVAADLADNIPKKRDKLYSYSNPRGAPGVLSIGTAGAVNYLDDHRLSQYTTVFAEPGSSGGGVFDLRGDLVGIVHSIGPGGITLIVPLPHVKEFLGR